MFWQWHRGGGLLGLEALLMWIIFVGCVGGAKYANCIHLMNTDTRVPTQYRELLLNVSFSYCNIAIVGSSVLSLILDVTAMSGEKMFMYPGGRGCEETLPVF